MKSSKGYIALTQLEKALLALTVVFTTVAIIWTLVLLCKDTHRTAYQVTIAQKVTINVAESGVRNRSISLLYVTSKDVGGHYRQVNDTTFFKIAAVGERMQSSPRGDSLYVLLSPISYYGASAKFFSTRWLDSF